MSTVILDGGRPTSFGNLLRSAATVYVDKQPTSQIRNTLDPSSYILCPKKLQGPQDEDGYFTERELRVKNISCSEATVAYMKQVVKLAEQGELRSDDPYANTPVYQLAPTEGQLTLKFSHLLKYTNRNPLLSGLHWCSDRKDFFVHAPTGVSNPCTLAHEFFEAARPK